jgi:hypothetical protein
MGTDGLMAEAASMPKAEAGRPAEIASEPRAATMAPLSVQSAGGGVRSSILAAAHRSWATARRRELAATPPAITSESIPVSLHALMDF